MNKKDQYLGTVKNGQFHHLVSSGSGGIVRLTSIHRQEARSPESGELHLADYEGRAIMVSGYSEGEWIFEVDVIDQAGPILTEVVQRVCNTTGPLL